MILFGMLLWYINLCSLFNAKSCLYIHIKYIWCFVDNIFVDNICKDAWVHFFAHSWMSISSFWPIDRILSGAITRGQTLPGNDGNEGVLRIPQSSSITGALQLDYLMSFQDTRCKGGVLPLYRDAVGEFYSSSWQK